MRFCSFLCEHADNNKAQHAACLAENGVYCSILEKVIDKGSPCAAEAEGLLPKDN